MAVALEAREALREMMEVLAVVMGAVSAEMMTGVLAGVTKAAVVLTATAARVGDR